jgi:hypothetical protein
MGTAWNRQNSQAGCPHNEVHIIVDEESSLIDRGANGVKLSAVIDSYGARERVA